MPARCPQAQATPPCSTAWTKKLPHPNAFNPKVLGGRAGHPLVVTEEPHVEKPSGMTHGKSSRTERDGGEAKLLPLTRPRRAFGPVPGPPPASYRAHPGRWDPRARQQSQNTNVKTCGRDREGVRLVSALTTHPTGFTWRINTKTRRNPLRNLALLTLRAAGVRRVRRVWRHPLARRG